MEGDVERLRLAVTQWITHKPPEHILRILEKDEEKDEKVPTNSADPRVQMRAAQVLRKIRNRGLKDYHQRKREYNLNRHPTPPPPEVSKKLRAPARAGVAKAVDKSLPKEKAMTPTYHPVQNVHLDRSSERQYAAIPKMMLQKDIFHTEAKIVHYRCGGHTGLYKEASEKVPEVKKSRSFVNEIIVLSSMLPEYNGTYIALRVDVPYWVCENRRLCKTGGRWKFEYTSYSWIECVKPHMGKAPWKCPKWDAWCADDSEWCYDPSIVVEASEEGVKVTAPQLLQYEGTYTISDRIMNEQQVWSKGSLSICSHDGHWVIYDENYSYIESYQTHSEQVPHASILWDKWEGSKRKWSSCNVSLILPVEKQTASEATFITQPKKEDDEANLFDYLPAINLPNFTIHDVLQGSVTEPSNDLHNELDDEQKEKVKMVEGLLFGFHGNMKINEAQKVLGLTYRQNDVESKLAPIPYDFGKFAASYGQEKSQFHQRCMKEIRRVANQRQSLFKKKRRILNDILRNAPDMKTSNPRWRHASHSMKQQMYNDLEKGFRMKRKSLLRRWLNQFKEALPSVLPPSCRAVLVYLDTLFDQLDLKLSKELYYSLCNDVLASHHFLLSDVLNILWCVKKLFQVTDDQYCELVKIKTHLLFEYNFQLPLLESEKHEEEVTPKPIVGDTSLPEI